MADEGASRSARSRDTRERDILLAYNEYAYVQDMTKGDINLYVGPTKISLSNTERMVRTDPQTGKVIPVYFDENGGVQNFVNATSAQYVVLENPQKDANAKYNRGPNTSIDLLVGKKTVKPGPLTFPLWPGQTAEVIEGHALKEDEYLLVRAYDIPTIDENIEKAEKEAGKEAEAGSTAGEAEDKKKEKTRRRQDKKIQIGTELVVKGSDVSFFIPPDGFEVVPMQSSSYVRKAIKLMDGEYCVLLTPNGEKKYVNGPNMVIPEPNETLMQKDDSYVFKAHTLKPEQGLHLYVTRDFSVADDSTLAGIIGKGDFKIGQELFVRDKEGLFFPNENLEIIGEVSPISLAENEGMYVREVETGEIKTVKGPKNFLPDPRKQEVVTRNLDERIEELYNLPEYRDQSKAVSVYVPPNHSVMVVSENERKVIMGPQYHVLDYSEDLEKLTLSTGTPKTDKQLLEAVFLQVEGNKVSDVVTVETKDHVMLDVKMSYRISFEDEPNKWFDVKNYVGLLCDHLSSLVRSSVKKLPLEVFYSDSTETIRDSVLGVKKEGEARTGRRFTENGMRVYDLEVLNIDVLDEDIDEMLSSAQQEAFQKEITKRRAELEFDLVTATEHIRQATNALKTQSCESELEYIAKQKEVRTREAEMNVEVDRMQKIGMAHNAVDARKIEYEHEKAKAEDQSKRKQNMLNANTQAYIARMEAVSPDLVSVLRRMGDQELLTKVAENLGELSVLEGKSIQDILQGVLRGLPLAARDLKQAMTQYMPNTDTSDQE